MKRWGPVSIMSWPATIATSNVNSRPNQAMAIQPAAERAEPHVAPRDDRDIEREQPAQPGDGDPAGGGAS